MKLLKTTFFSLMVTTVSLLPVQSMAEKSDAFGTLDKDSVFSSAVSDQELDTYRGTFGNATLQYTTLSGSLNGNTATGNVTGNNSISEGALNNVAGLTSVIQNSGNNVIIQQSTVVSVDFQN